MSGYDNKNQNENSAGCLICTIIIIIGGIIFGNLLWGCHEKHVPIKTQPDPQKLAVFVAEEQLKEATEAEKCFRSMGASFFPHHRNRWTCHRMRHEISRLQVIRRRIFSIFLFFNQTVFPVGRIKLL